MSEADPVNGSPAPLAGVRVLEFASMISGPYAGLLLGLLGAEVIKVERRSGDPFRGYGGYSNHFTWFNTGKKSVVVDVGDQRGLDAILRLVASSDVVFENSRPGQMEKLGLSEKQCREANPNLVYVAISGFGSVGPMADRPAYDAVGQAVSGFLSTTDTGAVPSVGPALGDIISGIVGASSVLAGLAGRGIHGVGSKIETSMMEALCCSIIDGLMDRITDGAEPDRATRALRSQIYSLLCSDGKYVVIQLSNSQAFFTNLTKAVGRPDLATDERFADYQARMANQPAMQAILSEIFLEKTSAEWDDVLARADVPLGVVQDLGGVIEHPQTDALQMFGPPDADGLRRYRGPWLIDGRRPPILGPAPTLGEHTREIFEGVLSVQEIDELISAGVLI